MAKSSSRVKAILLALLVTVLWSSSWVLIKIGLADIPPLLFAGLRYVWAFLVLLVVVMSSRDRRAELRTISGRDWRRIAALGLISYALTQGLMYVALSYLEAVTLSLMLNFTSVVVALIGIVWLREMPTGLQWLGVAIYLGGTVVYFYPAGLAGIESAGLIIGGIVVLANAISSLLGREVNREKTVSPLMVTVTSMGIGSLTLLAVALIIHGLPRIDLLGWAIIGWLAVVNSALAFTLWNHTQRTLSATESSVINNTMLIQIAVLAWLFLGEEITGIEVIGLALAVVGILLVQVRGRKTASNAEAPG
ncbi:MAG: EamA family transporter [Anaerolineae bacterium]|nr:EamA family transporter [Anaerolineae bacterium]